jgi:hypothetical protein
VPAGADAAAARRQARRVMRRSTLSAIVITAVWLLLSG